MAHATNNPADLLKNPFPHVIDSNEFEFFDGVAIHLPSIHLPGLGVEILITKFVVLELVAAFLVFLFLWPVARWMRYGDIPHGSKLKRYWWHTVESILLFIRDEVARPALGDPDAKKYLPYLWTTFLFILFCNLLGMLPFSGSPTASIAVTASLALIGFFIIHGSGIVVNGLKGYAHAFVPHLDAGDDKMMKFMVPVITVGICIIEVMSAFIRSFVLAVRLFANMLAGHTALYVLLLFIKILGMLAVNQEKTFAIYLFWPVTLMSVTMVTLLSVLELFVAVLQAFVYTFLTATFIGMARHPEH